MAGSQSDAYEADMLNYLVGRDPTNSNMAAPATARYLALFTTLLDDTHGTADAVGATEVSGGAYARQAIVGSFGTAATAGTISNDAEIAFPQATAGWGNIRSWAIVEGTGASAVILAYCTDPDAVNPGTGVPVNTDDIVKFATSQITVTAT